MNPTVPQSPGSTPSPVAAPTTPAAAPHKPAAATGSSSSVISKQSSVIGNQPSVASPRPAAASTPPPTPEIPNPLAHLSLPFHGVEYAARGYHAEATVAPDQVVLVAERLDQEGLALDTITGVDWIAEGQMEVVYDYFHPVKPLRVVVRTRIPRDNPEVPTIQRIYPGANWHERETHDFFGIRFLGHPNLTPFLLPEDATYHPLRKDYTA